MEAPDATSAAAEALRACRLQLREQPEVAPGSEESVQIHVEQVTRLPAWRRPPLQTGFVFFPEDHPRNVYVVTVLLLGLAMFGLVLRTRGAVNWLAWRPVVFVGEISYVFYLVHTFAINAVEDSGVNPFDGPSSVLVTVALALPIAIIGSYVVHRIVELPFIAIGRRLGHRDASQMHSVS